MIEKGGQRDSPCEGLPLSVLTLKMRKAARSQALLRPLEAGLNPHFTASKRMGTSVPCQELNSEFRQQPE